MVFAFNHSPAVSTNVPYQGVNGSLVNIDGSNFSGSAFTSTVLPQTVNPAVLPQPLSNVQGAASYIPCGQSGGGAEGAIFIAGSALRKSLHKYHKHKRGSSKMSKRVKSKKHLKKKHTRRTRRAARRRQRGGYGQYMNNTPYSPNYSLGGPLSPYNSALASPPPYHLNTLGENIDNYNHFTNMGFPSRN